MLSKSDRATSSADETNALCSPTCAAEQVCRSLANDRCGQSSISLQPVRVAGKVVVPLQGCVLGDRGGGEGHPMFRPALPTIRFLCVHRRFVPAFGEHFAVFPFVVDLVLLHPSTAKRPPFSMCVEAAE